MLFYSYVYIIYIMHHLCIYTVTYALNKTFKMRNHSLLSCDEKCEAVVQS